MKKTFLCLLVLATLLPTSLSTCVDSTTAIFVTNNGNRYVNRYCIWLKQKASKVSLRTNKFCEAITTSGSLVKNECQLSCSNCGGVTTSAPTKQPSRQPSGQPSITGATASPVSSSCVDSTTFKFVASNQKRRKCEFILANPSSVIDNRRISKFCNQADVKSACANSCNNCPTPSPSYTPSQQPSLSPSKEPSAAPLPTDLPSRPPSPFPSPFPTIRPSNNPSNPPSDNPSNNPTNTP